MTRRIRTIQDVVGWGLCVGCGACRAACDKSGVQMSNVETAGIRPLFSPDTCATCNGCLDVCPGYAVEAPPSDDEDIGRVLEIWEGHASDPEIRFRGSSGGVLSALALYCLEHEQFDSVLHSAIDGEDPLHSRTVFSTDRGEILDRTGSRYAPSSPCEALGEAADRGCPFVFIGKPCDAAGAAKLRRRLPALDATLGLSLTFFCAGTPSTQGTLDMLTSFGIPPRDLKELRYRGNGWPGEFRAECTGRSAALPYHTAWGRLTKYRPFRCNLCPDGLGRLADIACGDAWHRYTGDSNAGLSIVLVRTKRGRDILHRAMDAGYLSLEPSEPSAVLAAQENLLERRRQIFGRLVGMKLLAVPTPRFTGFGLLNSWMRRPLPDKIRTIAGTMRRVIRKGLWKKSPVRSAMAPAAHARSDASPHLVIPEHESD